MLWLPFAFAGSSPSIINDLHWEAEYNTTIKAAICCLFTAGLGLQPQVNHQRNHPLSSISREGRLRSSDGMACFFKYYQNPIMGNLGRTWGVGQSRKKAVSQPCYR